MNLPLHVTTRNLTKTKLETGFEFTSTSLTFNYSEEYDLTTVLADGVVELKDQEQSIH